MQGVALIHLEMRDLTGYVSFWVRYPLLSIKITKGFCLKENSGVQVGEKINIGKKPLL